MSSLQSENAQINLWARKNYWTLSCPIESQLQGEHSFGNPHDLASI